MLARKALVDFDGVILRNASANHFVSTRVQHYLQSKLHLPPPVISALNKEAYLSYGHTVTGLQKLGFSSISLEEFNAFVYENIPRTLHLTTADRRNWDIFYRNLQEADVSITIFSNAPTQWIQHFLNLRSYNIQLYEPPPLKPLPEAYPTATTLLSPQVYVFDDKLINLQPTLDRPQWHHYWVTPQTAPSSLSTNLHLLPCLADFKPHGEISDDREQRGSP